MSYKAKRIIVHFENQIGNGLSVEVTEKGYELRSPDPTNGEIKKAEKIAKKARHFLKSLSA